jgi:hypothetical protein
LIVFLFPIAMGTGLAESDKISIGVGLGVGIPCVLLAILAFVYRDWKGMKKNLAWLVPWKRQHEASEKE